MDPIYLDANASEPPLPAALTAATAVMQLQGNPSSSHAFGRRARVHLDEARDAVASAFGAIAREVTFFSGASEANRFVVDALQQPSRRFYVSPLEHPSLHKPLAALQPRVATVEADALAWDKAALAQADVVVCTAAHNETGLVPDVDALCAQVGKHTIVVCDASQAVGRLPVLPMRVDVIVGSGHKLGGIPGAGALVLRGNARGLNAGWRGGGQEAGLRPGTEAVAPIVAMGAACAHIATTRTRAQSLSALRDRLEQRLARASSAHIIGAARRRLPQTTALVIPDVDPAALRIAIDLSGVAVGFGAACSALAPEPSPSLLALGLDSRSSLATMRLSLPLSIDEATVDAAGERLVAVLQQLHRG